MQNIQSEFIITVKNYINITSFKMKGSPDLGQAVMYLINNSFLAYLLFNYPNATCCERHIVTLLWINLCVNQRMCYAVTL